MTTASATTERNAAVKLDGLSKTYPGAQVRAVNELSLNVEDGEVYTLLGPSGCGKTTTLRMVAGLEVPDEGDIYFGDREVVVTSRHFRLPPDKRDLGMVFQSYAIWPHMTVEENVAFPLATRHMKRSEIRERVAHVLDLVNLPGLQKRPAPLLSGGQQQRVALARALVIEPKILLLDEPFSNLDAKLREQMRVELKLLQKRLNIAVLFVTHDQIEALSLSNRIALMNLGIMQQQGPPQLLYEEPANEFVRDFIGKTVLLRGTVQSSNPSGQVSVAIAGGPELRHLRALLQPGRALHGPGRVHRHPPGGHRRPADVRQRHPAGRHRRGRQRGALHRRALRVPGGSGRAGNPAGVRGAPQPRLGRQPGGARAASRRPQRLVVRLDAHRDQRRRIAPRAHETSLRSAPEPGRCFLTRGCHYR